MSIRSTGKVSSPHIILKSEHIKNENGTFIIDTGAELNLMKYAMVKSLTSINTKIKYNLFGITKEGIETFGEVHVNIKGYDFRFQVVPNDFPLNGDGMVGMPFLVDSVLDLKTKTVKHKLGEFSFSIPPKKGKILFLKARTKQIISLPVLNDDLSEGYLSLVSAGPNVFLDNSLVAIKDGNILIHCINSGTRDVELSIPPVNLEEVESIKFSSAFKKVNKNEEKSENKVNFSDRIKKLENELDLEHLNAEGKESLLNCIAKFPYQFFLDGDKLSCTNVIKHKTNTIDDTPVKRGNYIYPPIHKEVIEKEIEKLKHYKAISLSTSAYNSPVWVVPKNADSQGRKRWRMVIDYRGLNEKSVGDAYPLPNITDILDQLGGAKYFSVLDLASGFHQIEIDEAGRHKTAFSTLFGLYKFNRMPFGLKSAPATFQRMMDMVLSGLQGVEMFVYMDDIVIYAK